MNKKKGEVKTSPLENKTPEVAPKGASETKASEETTKGLDPKVIIDIVKKIIDLFKSGKKDEAFSQIQASNQNIELATLQAIFNKTASEILSNITEKTSGAEESKDSTKELESKILKILGLDDKKMGVKDLAETPATNTTPTLDHKDNEIVSKKINHIDHVIGKNVDNIEKNSPSIKNSIPTNEVSGTGGHVERLQAQRQVSNEKSGGRE